MSERYRRLRTVATALVNAIDANHDLSSHYTALRVELKRLENDSPHVIHEQMFSGECFPSCMACADANAAAANVLVTGRDDYEHRGLDGNPTGLVLDRVAGAEYADCGEADLCPVCHRACVDVIHPECSEEVGCG